MTANKPGALNQKPLYGCTSCFEDYSWPAEDLRVHDSECWCGQCWEESRWEFPDRPSWSDLEPYTPALQAECERLKATLESLLDAAPDVQKPAPDVVGLVDALEQCITSMLDSGCRADAVVIRAARSAIAAHRKQEGG